MEVRKLPQGTPVKIKDSVDCAEIFKKGGELVHQDISQLGNKKGEKTFGIKVDTGVCYYFNNDDYEIIDEK